MGLETAWQEEVRLLFADPARTVVEILDAPRIGGGIRHAAEILQAYLDEHEGERLVEYALRLGNRAVLKRLGFLLESQGWGAPELIAAFALSSPAASRCLIPTGPDGAARAGVAAARQRGARAAGAVVIAKQELMQTPRRVATRRRRDREGLRARLGARCDRC